MCFAYVVMPLVALLNRLKRPAQARKSGAMMECPLGECLEGVGCKVGVTTSYK